jgi:transcriptional regulator with PAS, ATPase and Fis domain
MNADAHHEQESLSLTIRVPGREVRTIPLESGSTYALGRHETADIVLDHPSVSGRHAILTMSDPPSLVDVGSPGGTYVDGDRLLSHEPVELGVSCTITLGSVSLLFGQCEQRLSGVRRAASFGFDPKESTPVNAAVVSPVLHNADMRRLYAFAKQAAPTSVSVLVTGETGVGKELMAQAIHRFSPRAHRELVVLNCAAIPENLVESELFGYERGAFSGAVGPKPGLFEAAHGSTLFLDEVGELPLSVQAKLLRVLETGDVPRLGAVRPTRVDVRIVAATNRNLLTEIARGAFRNDLYYRLNGLTISIPPLRERPEDIEELARHFSASAMAGTRVRFSDAALAALRAHPWPGNVRELKSVIQRATLVKRGEQIEPVDLLFDAVSPSLRIPAPATAHRSSTATEVELSDAFSPAELPTAVIRAELEQRELRRTKEALERTAGNQTEASILLGISRQTLMNRMDRLGISRPRKGSGRNSDE